MKHRVCLIGEETIFRESLQHLIETRSEYQVIESREPIPAALLPPCDLLVIDCSLFDGAAQLVLEARSQRPDLPIVMLVSGAREGPTDLLDRGAYGLVPKTASPHDLFECFKEVGRGRAYVHPRLGASLIGSMRGRKNTPGGLTEPLTVRERDVLLAAARGAKIGEIATRLGLSISTVKTHLRGLYRKLDAADRTQAVLEALRRGLINEGDISAPGDPKR